MIVRNIFIFICCLAWVTSGQAETPRPSAEDFIGGSSSIGAQLQLDNQAPEVTFLEPWYSFKNQLREQDGFDFNLDYATLYQTASASSTGNDDAFSGVFRIYGKWELLGRGTKDTGSIVWKFESRDKLGGDVAPGDLGVNLGYFGVTGTSFSDVGSFLHPLYWEQFLRDGRVGIVAGRIDSVDFVDISGYSSQWRRFQNASLLVNSAIPFPDVGLGAGAGFRVGDDWVLGATVHDANGSQTEVDWLVDGAEFFKEAYVSWSPGRAQRMNRAAHFTVWHADERTASDIEDGWGLALSGNWLFDSGLMPFVRAGWADGAAARADVAVIAGMLYRPESGIGEFGGAFGWESLSDDSLGNQKAAEVFFRWDVTPNFSLTPSVQALIDPALNQSDDVIILGGVRARVSF